MKNSFLKSLEGNKFITSLHIVSVILLVFVMPFKIKLVTPLTISSFFFLMLHKNYWTGLKNKFKSKYFLISISVFVVSVLGIVYTEKNNIVEGLSDVQVKLMLLIFPLIIYQNDILKQHRDRIVNTFIGGVVLAFFICIFNAVNNSIYIENEIYHFNSAVFHWIRDKSFIELFMDGNSFFSGNRLSEELMHHSYIALYALNAIIISVYKIIYYRKSSVLYKWLYIFITILLICFFVMLQSRANYIAFLFLLLVFGIYYIVNGKRRILKLIIPVTLVLSILFLGNYTRLSRNFNTDIITNYNKVKDENVRLQIWHVSYQIIKDHSLIGVGTGDIKNKLIEKYQDNNIKSELYLNAHNQFLEILIGHGALGLLIMLLWLIVPLIQSIKQSQLIHIAFIITVITNFLFESILNRFAGVSFIAFWYSFLWFVYYKDDDQHEETSSLTPPNK